MEGFIDYLVKLAGTLMVVYLFYWLVLRRLTFYVSNRWYLLGYSIASILIPFVNVNPLLRSAQLEDDQFVQLVPVLNTEDFDQNTSTQVNAFWDGKDILLALFAAGIVVMFIRFIIQYFSVRSVRNASLLISAGDVNVYHIDKNIVPFSFGNSIFINRYKHSEDDLRDIIKHEFIHVKQKHTIDILWGELLCVLNWYNPFAWLIRNAIRQNLEFIADSKVLQNGIDKKQYQYLLLKVVGVHQNGIATSFNFTSLKKRIAMMNKMRSAKVHVIKFLFVLPLLAVILLAFRDKVTDRTFHTESISGALILADQASDDLRVIDTVPAPKKPTVRDRPAHFFKPNDKGYIITIADNHGECLVVVRDKTQKIVKCLTLVEWDEKEKEYTGTYGEISGIAPKPPTPPVQPEVPKAPGAPAMPDNISSIHVKDKKLTIVTKTGETEIYDLDKPEEKENFQKKYGLPASPQNPQSTPNPPNKRQAPVIIDIRENKPATLAPVERETDSILPEKIKRATVTINTPEDFQGLIILDDKEYDKKTFDRDVKLDASAIRHMEVYKNEKAVQLYGEKGKNGVIRIVTK